MQGKAAHHNMSPPGHRSILPAEPRHGIVLVRADSRTKRKRGCRRAAPDLQLEPDMFGDACVSGLVDDWIVPMVVERIIQDILKKPPSNAEE